MAEDLDEKVAVVTGAGSGIGAAIALCLASRCRHVCLVGRTLEKLEQVAGRAQPGSACIAVHAADLTRDDDIARLRRELVEGPGKVDVLVHSAGIIVQDRLEDASIDDFDRQYRANVRGPYLLTQSLLPMLKACRGQVVFINSSVGLAAKPGAGQYSATQHAVKAIADSLRDEVNAEGIRVVSIFPGRTATPRQEMLYGLQNQPYRPELLLQPEDVASVVAHVLALPRTAEVTNVNMRPMLKSY